MTDPDHSGTSSDEAGSEQETPLQDQAQSTEAGATETDIAESGVETPQSTDADATKPDTAESGAETPQSATPQSTTPQSTTPQSTEDADGQTTEEKQDNQPKHKKSKAGLLLGLVSGAFVLLLALVLVAFFVWPGYAGPGSPDSKVDETMAALSSKDSGQLDQVSCHGEDGKPLAQISPDALQLVQSAKPAGGPQMLLDTEAHAPVDLTLSAQGKTQTLPSTAVLGVSHHQWCLKGLAQRQ